MKSANIAALAAACFVFSPALAQDHTSGYAGQEAREIKSLSPDDIAELRRGGGWGLAKAAELNGVPGPAHLLEMKADVPLSTEQVATIQSIFDAMKSDAIVKGEQLISLEKQLESRFQAGDITDADLHELLTDIANTRRDLRYIHLATHLQTPDILSQEQIDSYNRLRGYDSDPCTNIPAGHDPEIWKKHNGCTD